MNAFFSTQKIPVTGKLAVVNVGHQGDSGFRSVAAGIIDAFLVHPNLNEAMLKKMLERYFIYYPSLHPTSETLLNERPIMEQLIAQLPLPKLMESMAYTLRQLAVDEMITKPGLEYSQIFQHMNKQADLALIREYHTWLDKSSLLALARILNIPIDIRECVHGKELPLPALSYNSSAENEITNPKIIIELEEKQYRPRVLNTNFIHSAVYDSPHSLITPMQTKAHDAHSLLDIQTILKKENDRIVFEFEQKRSYLMSKIRAGELSKKQLLDVFVEYASAWASIPSSESTAWGLSHSYLKSKDEEIIEGIVATLARAIALGTLPADEIVEQLETKAHLSRERF